MRCYGYSPTDSSSSTKNNAIGYSCSSAVSHRENDKYQPMDFLRKKDDEPSMEENLLEKTKRMLRKMHCTPKENLECATSLLQDEAYQLWLSVTRTTPPEGIT